MCMQIADDSNAIELALETASYESHEFISLRRKGRAGIFAAISRRMAN